MWYLYCGVYFYGSMWLLGKLIPNPRGWGIGLWFASNVLVAWLCVHHSGDPAPCSNNPPYVVCDDFEDSE